MSKKSAFARAIGTPTLRNQVSKHRAAPLAALLKHPEIKRAFNSIPAALRADAWIGGAEYDNSVQIGLTLNNLDSFKDKTLIKVLTPFTTDDAWVAHTSDWAYTQPNRDYIFNRTLHLVHTPAIHDAIQRHPSARWLRANGYAHHVPTTLDLRVAIYAYVKSDSPSCRVVVKGVTERVVREEIKEIVCE
jgi:hypothetical protein